MPVTQRPLNSHSKRFLVLGVIGLVALATVGVERLLMRPTGPDLGRVGSIEKLAENLYMIPEYAEFTRAFLDAVRTRKKAGETPEQVAATLTLPAKFKDYDMSTGALNVATTFAESPPRQ
jgi:hypothetical protein